MKRTTRRSFIRETLISAATITIAGTKSSGRVLGANDAIRLGIAGLNGRGRDHLTEFAKLKGVQITYLIDPDRRVFGKGIREKDDKETLSPPEWVRAKCGTAPKTTADVRVALQDRDLDAISIATPNHWHALMTIWACEARKDVFVEKPSCHTLTEGHMATAYARKYDRIVQHGTQNRSDPAWHKVAAIIQSGKLGKLLVSRGLCYKPRGSIGVKPTEPAPADLDFNLWLGPAAERPFHKNLVPYNWHWFWDFGDGDIGNQGVHQMDIARWMIPKARFPKNVISIGGRFGYQDQGETANTQIALFDYGPTQLIFEVRGLNTSPLHGQKIGNICHLEEGTIVGNNKFIAKGRKEIEPLPDFGVEVKTPSTMGNHYANFIAAVRTRRMEDLTAELEEGFYSSALCQLANASYRVGEMTPFDKKPGWSANKDATEAFARMEEHLRDNNVPLDGQSYRVGKKLTYNIDLDNVSQPDARAILSGTYRKGFAIPEKVL
jgi:predicted dehydrogenase